MIKKYIVIDSFIAKKMQEVFEKMRVSGKDIKEFGSVCVWFPFIFTSTQKSSVNVE